MEKEQLIDELTNGITLKIDTFLKDNDIKSKEAQIEILQYLLDRVENLEKRDAEMASGSKLYRGEKLFRDLRVCYKFLLAISSTVSATDLERMTLNILQSICFYRISHLNTPPGKKRKPQSSNIASMTEKRIFSHKTEEIVEKKVFSEERKISVESLEREYNLSVISTIDKLIEYRLLIGLSMQPKSESSLGEGAPLLHRSVYERWHPTTTPEIQEDLRQFSKGLTRALNASVYLSLGKTLGTIERSTVESDILNLQEHFLEYRFSLQKLITANFVTGTFSDLKICSGEGAENHISRVELRTRGMIDFLSNHPLVKEYIFNNIDRLKTAQTALEKFITIGKHKYLPMARSGNQLITRATASGKTIEMLRIKAHNIWKKIKRESLKQDPRLVNLFKKYPNKKPEMTKEAEELLMIKKRFFEILDRCTIENRIELEEAINKAFTDEIDLEKYSDHANGWLDERQKLLTKLKGIKAWKAWDGRFDPKATEPATVLAREEHWKKVLENFAPQAEESKWLCELRSTIQDARDYSSSLIVDSIRKQAIKHREERLEARKKLLFSIPEVIAEENLAALILEDQETVIGVPSEDQETAESTSSKDASSDIPAYIILYKQRKR